MKVLRLNRSGMSMIEIMMSVGLTSIVALGMATMISGVSKQVRQQEDKLNVISTKSEILTNVQSKVACTNLLAGQSIANGSPLVLGAFKKGALIGNRVIVNDIVVSNVSLIDAATNSYSAEVSVEMKDSTNPILIYKPLEFVLYYTTVSGTLNQCGNSGTLADLMASCSSIGATWDTVSNSCNIDNAVCSSLGGTIQADGTCSALTAASPTLAGCNAKIISFSDSSPPKTSNPRSSRYSITCSITASSHGQINNGFCNIKPGSRGGGTCQYQCNDGNWSKVTNTCYGGQ